MCEGQVYVHGGGFWEESGGLAQGQKDHPQCTRGKMENIRTVTIPKFR